MRLIETADAGQRAAQALVDLLREGGRFGGGGSGGGKQQKETEGNPNHDDALTKNGCG